MRTVLSWLCKRIVAQVAWEVGFVGVILDLIFIFTSSSTSHLQVFLFVLFGLMATVGHRRMLPIDDSDLLHDAQYRPMAIAAALGGAWGIGYHLSAPVVDRGGTMLAVLVCFFGVIFLGTYLHIPQGAHLLLQFLKRRTAA